MAQGTQDINPTPDRQVFVSGDANHRLVRVPQSEVGVVANGQVTGQAKELNPALAYQFVEGYLVIDDQVRARDARFFKQYGKALEIDDRRPAEEWLRGHANHGVERGFHEIEAPAPDLLGPVSDALLAGDIKALVGLYEREEGAHARPDVLENIQNAIESLEERERVAAAAASG